MAKIDREKVWMMFGKRCAYCGCELKTFTGKDMQVDHVKPIRRNKFSNDSISPENDITENLFPSCAPCNNYKHSMDLETFRDQIGLALVRLQKVASYRNALRFGMVNELVWDRKFWFEIHRVISNDKF